MILARKSEIENREPLRLNRDLLVKLGTRGDGAAVARPRARRAPPPRAVADDDTDEDPPFVDLYAALELAKGASGGAIKKAYRALALRWHVDKNAGDAEAHARFQDISKAYAVLSDPTKRAYYDQTGDVEDIDVSADDFVRTFVVMMDDLLGGGTIEDMLDGLGDADFASMPPFPFPKHLFPPARSRRTCASRRRFPSRPRSPSSSSARAGGAAAAGLRAQSENERETRRRRRRLDSSRSSEWESDDDLVFARASDRDRGAGTRAGGGRGVAVSGDARPKTSTPRSSTTKTSATPSSRRCCARCLPRCSSSSCARTRAPAARRARRRPRSWRFWRRWGCRSRGCRPSSPGSWGRAAAAAAAGDSARLGKRARPGAGPAGPGEGGGGGARAGARRARSRHAGQSAFRRGKRVGLPGPGRRRRTARARTSRPRDARGRVGRFFFAAPKGRFRPGGSTPGSRTEKNRRKKARKKTKEREKDTEKDTEKEGSVHEGSVTREMHEDADGPTSNAAEGVAWAPDAFYARRREDATGSVNSADALSTDADGKGRPRSFAALGRRGESRGRRRLARRTRGEVRGRARRGHGSRPAKSTPRRVLEHRSPGIGHTALHWSASRGIDALDATAWLLDVCLDDVIETNDEKTETNAGAKNRREKSAPARTRPNAREPGGRHASARGGGDRVDGGARFARSFRRGPARAGRGGGNRGGRRGEAGARVVRVGVSRRRGGFFRASVSEPTARVSRRPASGRSRRAASERAGGLPSASEAAERAPNRTAATTRRREPRSSPRRPPRRGARGTRRSAAGEFAKAVKQFTMAIRMDKTNHVLFSNRSAAHAGLGKYEDALADAERCVRMSPKWGKGYGRKGAALTGLGQGGEAVKAYLAGLAVEPESEALRAGLAEAKAAIRQAQDRYKEMWGKDAPHSGSSAEDVSDAPREGTGDRETKTTPKSPTRATSPNATLGDTKTPSLETLAATREVNALPRAETKRWLEAARGGELATLENMLSVNRAFLHAWGKGTNFGFTANTAMHWAASKGHADVAVAAARGARPRTHAITTTVRRRTAPPARPRGRAFLLLAEGGADATLRDRRDETARDVAIAAGAKNKTKTKSVSRRTARGWRRRSISARASESSARTRAKTRTPRRWTSRRAARFCSWRGWRRARSRRSTSSSTRRASTRTRSRPGYARREGSGSPCRA